MPTPASLDVRTLSESDLRFLLTTNPDADYRQVLENELATRQSSQFTRSVTERRENSALLKQGIFSPTKQSGRKSRMDILNEIATELGNYVEEHSNSENESVQEKVEAYGSAMDSINDAIAELEGIE